MAFLRQKLQQQTHFCWQATLDVSEQSSSCCHTFVCVDRQSTSATKREKLLIQKIFGVSDLCSHICNFRTGPLHSGIRLSMASWKGQFPLAYQDICTLFFKLNHMPWTRFTHTSTREVNFISLPPQKHLHQMGDLPWVKADEGYFYSTPLGFQPQEIHFTIWRALL